MNEVELLRRKLVGWYTAGHPWEVEPTLVDALAAFRKEKRVVPLLKALAANRGPIPVKDLRLNDLLALVK